MGKPGKKDLPARMHNKYHICRLYNISLVLAFMRSPLASRYLIVIAVCVLLLSSCKTGKTILSSYPPPQDTVTAVADTLVIPADTLRTVEPPVPDTVELQVYRVLKDTLEITGVGDIMMGTNFPDESYLPSGNGEDLWREVAGFLNRGDVTFGNLEGTILNEGGTQKKCSNPDVCYLFRTPERLASNLLTAGFDVMSLANNHAGDFGDEGRENTMRILDSLGIFHAGLLQRPFVTFMKEGMRYGFAAFAPNTGTVSIHDLENARSLVAHLDSISDVVIISFHGGAEGAAHQNMTRQTEYYYGENRGNIYEFAHAMVDAGADIIFGHGPHVVRAIEVYNERFIAYSLGNFCTYARFNLKGENGVAPVVKVFTDSSGKFLFGQVIPFVQEGEGGPVADPKRKAILTLQRLQREDFPETGLTIGDDGFIFTKDLKVSRPED